MSTATDTRTAHQKLGTDVSGLTTAQEILARAGADYEVSLHSMRVAHPADPTQLLSTGKNFTMTTRPIQISEEGVLSGGEDVVIGTGLSSKYQPISNEEITELALNLAGGLSDGQVGHAGTYRDLAVFFVQVPLEDLVLPGGDTIKRGLVASGAHDGSRAVQIAQHADRVFCGNQLSGIWAKATQKIAIRHTQRALEQPMALIKQALELTMTADEQFVAMAHQLADKPMAWSEVETIMGAMFPVKADASARTKGSAERRTAKIRDYWMEESAEFGSTAWAGFNAMSSWMEHDKTIRGQGRAERAVEDAYFGQQIGAVAKQFATA